MDSKSCHKRTRFQFYTSLVRFSIGNTTRNLEWLRFYGRLIVAVGMELYTTWINCHKVAKLLSDWTTTIFLDLIMLFKTFYFALISGILEIIWKIMIVFVVCIFQHCTTIDSNRLEQTLLETIHQSFSVIVSYILNNNTLICSSSNFLTNCNFNHSHNSVVTASNIKFRRKVAIQVMVTVYLTTMWCKDCFCWHGNLCRGATRSSSRTPPTWFQMFRNWRK